VLTHNIYFHKEITFERKIEKREKDKKKRTPTPKKVHFIFRKSNDVSSIEEKEENRFKSSYEMLWDELREAEDSSNNVTIFNAMRRILEFYMGFSGFGGFEDLEKSFEGNDRLIVKTLIPWLHDESHHVYDDYYVCSSPDIICKAKEMFRKVFDLMGHLDHHDMMMKIPPPPAESIPVIDETNSPK